MRMKPPASETLYLSYLSAYNAALSYQGCFEPAVLKIIRKKSFASEFSFKFLPPNFKRKEG